MVAVSSPAVAVTDTVPGRIAPRRVVKDADVLLPAPTDANVFVPYEPALDVSATVASRCVAGKVVQIVTIANGETVAVEVTTTSSYGTKTTPALGAGKR